MQANTKPFTYYGGKTNMLCHITPLIPVHTVYVEPFLGGGSLFWSKPASKLEVINDIDGRITNFYSVCANERTFKKLQTYCKQSAFSEALNKQSAHMLKCPFLYDKVQLAWATWYNLNTSYNAKFGSGYNTSNLTNSDHKPKAFVRKRNQWLTNQFFNRLKNVDIQNRDAISIIKYRDTVDTLLYIDPPYYNSNMGHYADYSLENYTLLLHALANVKGKFILSCYPSPIIAKAIKELGWYCQ